MAHISILTGHVANPELKFLESGKSLFKFSLAVDKWYLDRQTGDWKNAGTIWYEGTVWDEQATRFAEAKWFVKGAKVEVTCKHINYRTWQGNDGTTKVSLVLEGIRDIVPLMKPERSEGAEAAASDEIS